jgi:two-component sensor histidine kinase
MERGRLASVVFASHRAVHHWTENELRFVRQVGDRVYAALARIRADQQQRIVNEELSHRLKNTLAMVQAVATQTLGHVTERDAVSALTQRIGALARAHDVLLHQNWTQSRMGDVTQAVLSTFDSGNRFRMTGPNVMLGARATLSYSLLLHEMGTNALKYGALSVPEGHVEIEWRISGHASEAVLDLTWQEFGGPAPTENTERGFGSRLIRMGLIGTGGVEIKYPATGLSAHMEALLSQMQQ